MNLISVEPREKIPHKHGFLVMNLQFLPDSVKQQYCCVTVQNIPQPNISTLLKRPLVWRTLENLHTLIIFFLCQEKCHVLRHKKITSLRVFQKKFKLLLQPGRFSYMILAKALAIVIRTIAIAIAAKKAIEYCNMQ